MIRRSSRLTFRDHLIAASLKQLYNESDYDDREAFRDHLIAASLKRGFVVKQPAIVDRSFRDHLIAASLKHCDPSTKHAFWRSFP